MVPQCRGDDPVPAKPAKSIFDDPNAKPSQTQTPIKVPPASQPTTEVPRESPASTGSSGRITHLLPLKDAPGLRKGRWEQREDCLVSDVTNTSSGLILPYRPPEEYDIVLELARLEGSGSLSLTFSKNLTTGTFNIGANENRFAPFGEIDGHYSDPSNPSRVETSLENGRRYKLVLKIRDAGLEAWLDGKLLCQHRTDYSDLCGYEPNAPSVPRLLKLNTYKSSMALYTVDVIDVRGQGAPAQRGPDGTFVNPQPITAAPGGALHLHAVDASCHGGINFSGHQHALHLAGWNSKNDYISWSVEVKQAGDYTVRLNYACPDDHAGSQCAIGVNDEDAKLAFQIPTTGGWSDYRPIQCGTIHLGPGKSTISLRWLSGSNIPMDVNEAVLSPAK
jgi:hypothetical protein